MNERTCARCGETKPLDEFNRSQASKGGRGGYCRACCAVYHATYRARHLEEIRARDRAYRARWRAARRVPDVDEKRCSRCERVLPLVAFSRSASTKSGLHGYCRECLSAYNKEWRAANREAVLEKKRDYRERKKAESMASAWRRMVTRDR